jgi:uncharacterized protein YggE
MKRLALIATIILAGCLAIPAAGMDLILPVEGVGTVSVPADTTTIIVSASSGSGNISQDQEAVRQTMDRAIKALKAAGIKDDEITIDDSAALSSASSRREICQTINNKTVCDNSSMQATALTLSAMVKLNSTEKERIDQLLDAAKSAGTEAYVAGYGLFNSTAAQSRAKDKAAANARVDAEQMAAAEGLRLGQVLNISDYGYPEDFYGGVFELSGKDIVDVTSYVIVTYELEM